MANNRRRILGIDWDAMLPGELKRKLLYFDQIGVINLPQIKGSLWRDDEILREYEWAEENELIFHAKPPSWEFANREANSRLFSNGMKCQLIFDILSDAHWHGARPEEEDLAALADYLRTLSVDKAAAYLMRFHWVWRECLARLRAAELSDGGELDAVSAMPLAHAESINLMKGDGELVVPRNAAVEIVVGNIPLPSETTPWEQIIDFRDDPDSRQRLLSLRQWTRDVTAGNMKPFEIEEKLEFLLEEYRAHMRLHKMKFGHGALQTVITTTAEIIENLVKVSVGKIAKSLFDVQEKRIALLEAERKAPGREVSYVIKASTVFGDT